MELVNNYKHHHLLRYNLYILLEGIYIGIAIVDFIANNIGTSGVFFSLNISNLLFVISDAIIDKSYIPLSFKSLNVVVLGNFFFSKNCIIIFINLSVEYKDFLLIKLIIKLSVVSYVFMFISLLKLKISDELYPIVNNNPIIAPADIPMIFLYYLIFYNILLPSMNPKIA